MKNDVNYVSPVKLKKLKEELEYRKNTLRKQISEQIATAKQQGDLSENFEYQDAKERQGENEVRIANIDHMIKNAVLVETKTGESEISLGTTFRVELEDGGTKTFELVGSSEADPVKGRISNESPIGNAFMGKEVGETVEIEVPSGAKKYKITKIQ